MNDYTPDLKLIIFSNFEIWIFRIGRAQLYIAIK